MISENSGKRTVCGLMGVGGAAVTAVYGIPLLSLDTHWETMVYAVLFFTIISALAACLIVDGFIDWEEHEE